MEKEVNFDDGEPVTWSAQWEFIDDMPPESNSIRMVFRDSRLFVWWYPEVKQGYDDLQAFLLTNGIVDATGEEVQELKEFLEHWISLVDNEGSILHEMLDDQIDDRLDDIDFEEGNTIH